MNEGEKPHAKIKHQENYKCPQCGAENKFILRVERDFNYIYDGPYNIVGHVDCGSRVYCNCNVCGEELDPGMEEIQKWHKSKGLVFYNK